MPKRTLYFSLLFVMTVFSGFGQGRRIMLQKRDAAKPVYFNHITRKEGLPSANLLCAVQDHEGFMWLGTENGLARCDGSSVLVLQHDPSDPASICDNSISALALGPDSMIWTGTINGLSIIDPATLRAENFPLTTGFHGSQKVKCLFTGEEGAAWIGTQNGIFRLDLRDRSLTHYLGGDAEFDITRESRLNEVAFILADPRNNDHLLLGTNGGLVLFDKLSGRILRDYVHVLPPAIGGHYGAYSGWTDNSLRVWTHGWITGINIFDLRSEQWTDLAFSGGMPAISRILPAGKEFVLASTLNTGIIRIDLRTREYTCITSTDTKEKPLISDFLASITIDRDGMLWAMGEGGASIEDKNFKSFRQENVPLRHGWISSFYKDPDGRKFYAGAYDCDGLFCRDEATGHWSLLTPDQPFAPGGFCINTLFRDREGTLWIGSRSSLFRLDPSAGRLVLFRTPDGKPLDLSDKVIYAVFEDSQGNLWLGTRYEGVIRIDPTRTSVRYFRHADGDPSSLLEGSHIKGIREDRKGRIWIGTSRGFCNYNPATGIFSADAMRQAEEQGIIRRSVYSIGTDSLGRMWLSCDRQGLLRAEETADGVYRFKLFTTRHGLYDAELLYFTEDPDGQFWIVNHALVCMNPYTETFRTFSVYNGLHEAVRGDVKTYADAEGNIYVGDEQGFETIGKDELSSPAPFFNLVLEGIDVNGEPYPRFSRRMPEGYRFIFAANERNLTFRFTTVSFSQPGKVSYIYFLEGYDQDWSKPGENREARYTNLPPGTYTFRVRATAGGGSGEMEQTVLLTIRQHFYTTWWFILSCAAALAAFVFIYTRNRRRQRSRLEQLRTRIASDLHDDISSTLSSISILSTLVAGKTREPETSEMIGEIGHSARNMLEQTDDIIWAVNPRNDRFQDLGLRIREYAIPLFESKNIAFRIEYPEAMGSVRIPMDVRRNLYLIAKEAVNNLVKYSGCTEAVILFTQEHSKILLEIRDNGKGFDPSRKNSRNGLRNMALRAERINAVLQVESSPGHGTRIRAELKIK